jgi:hypothetical protein
MQGGGRRRRVGGVGEPVCVCYIHDIVCDALAGIDYQSATLQLFICIIPLNE